MHISITDIKKHINIEDCHTADDAYLRTLYQVAEQAVCAGADTLLSNLIDSEGELIPIARHAILLLIGHWYSSREAVSYGTPKTLPLGYDYLVAQLRNYGANNSNYLIRR